MIHTTTDETLAVPRQVTMQDVMSPQATFPFWEIHEMGIEISIDCAEDDWRSLANAAASAFQASGVTHCRMVAKLADVLNFGFNKYGERASDIVECTAGFMKLSAKTIENAMTTFLKIPEARRRVDELTLEHHKAVQKLSDAEQEEFLALAVDEGMSVSGLKEAINERHPKNTVTKKSSRSANPDAPEVTEEEAKECAEKILLYFEDQEKPENKGKLSTWPKSDVVRWSKLLHDHEMLAKRLRNAAKKAKA